MIKNSFVLLVSTLLLSAGIITSADELALVQQEKSAFDSAELTGLCNRLLLSIAHLSEITQISQQLQKNQEALELQMRASGMTKNQIDKLTEKIGAAIQENKTIEEVVEILMHDATTKKITKSLRSFAEHVFKAYSVISVASALQQDMQETGQKIEQFRNNLIVLGYSEKEAEEIVLSHVNAILEAASPDCAEATQQ